MKLVFLTRLFHPHIGGVETHVRQLSLALLPKGFDITIVTTQHENSLSLKDVHQGINIVRIPRENTLSKFGIWSWIGNNRHLFDSADLIHIHDVFWWFLLLRPFSQTPVFTTFHGWEGVYPPKRSALVLRKLAEKLSLGNVCVGDFIPKWYGTQPDLVTYGATNVGPLVKGSRDRILVFGRLSKENDISIAISGLKLIKDRNPKIKITFLGDGDLAWEAEKIGKVLGFQSDVQKYLSQHHWVVASSYLTILDSLAAGREVFSVYSNPLKKDYLTLHPAAKYLSIAVSPTTLADVFANRYLDTTQFADSVSAAQGWALGQTWDKLADQYIGLWSKKAEIGIEQLKHDLESDSSNS